MVGGYQFVSGAPAGSALGFWTPPTTSGPPYHFLDEVRFTPERPLSETSKGETKPNGKELDPPTIFCLGAAPGGVGQRNPKVDPPYRKSGYYSI